MTVSRIELTELSRVGFGCYRVQDDVHAEALATALDRGCNLVDTAPNYGDGRSEEIVGRVLRGLPARPAFVITKVGYVTPSSAAAVGDARLDRGDLRRLDGATLYGLDPRLLGALMDQSRRRLGRANLDAVLLHNPEHALDPDRPDPDKARRDLERALAFLTDEVSSGRLRCFGVSSNALVTQPGEEATDWLAAGVFAAAADDGFAILQFPFNMLERGAVKRDGDGSNLIERAGALEVRTVSNRPLNALGPSGRVRLALYPPFGAEGRAEAERCFEECVTLVSKRLRERGEERAWEDFTPMRFLRDNRVGVEDPEMVDLLWTKRIQPFVEVLEGETPWPEGRDGFRKLRALMRAAAQARLEADTLEALNEIGRGDWVGENVRDSLAQKACRYCLESGVDHVLVGMRVPRYVSAMGSLLAAEVPSYSQPQSPDAAALGP